LPISSDPGNSRSGGRSAAWALAVLAAISTCGFIDRIIIYVLVQPIKAEFRLSDTEIGLLIGLAFSVLNVSLGIWLARIAERRRRITLIGIGTLAWSAATAACAGAGSFLTLALARIGVGIGEACGLPATSSVVADYFVKQKRTSAMSVLLLAPPVGAFLGAMVGGIVAQSHGWRAAFLVASAPGFILSILVLLTVAEPPRGQQDGLGAASNEIPPLPAVLHRMWHRHSFRHLLIGSAIASMVGFGVNAYLSAYLARRFHFGLAEAAMAQGLLTSAPATLGVLGSGWLADRMARKNPSAYGTIPGWSLLAAAPLYILAVTRQSPAAAIALLAVAALFQYTYLAPSQGVFQNLMHPRMRASSAAVTGLVYSLIGAGLGPLIVGVLSDRLALYSERAGSGGGLTLALAVTASGYLWAAFHFFRATRSLARDLAMPL
jgi:predicted MFS family arabinose efflux permease